MAKEPLNTTWEHPDILFPPSNQIDPISRTEHGLNALIQQTEQRWRNNQCPLFTAQEQQIFIMHPHWAVPALQQCVDHFRDSESTPEFQIRRQVLAELLFNLSLSIHSPAMKKYGKAFQVELEHLIEQQELQPDLQQKVMDLLLESRLSLLPEICQAWQTWRLQCGLVKWKKGGLKNGDPKRRRDQLLQADSYHLAAILHQNLSLVDGENQLRWLSLLAAAEEGYALETLPFLLLHANERVRRAIPDLLRGLLYHKRFSPQMLRRVLVMRHWVPGPERKDLDRLIRGARLGGVEPLHWEQGEVVRSFVCSLNGRKGQGIWTVIANNQVLLASCLVLDPDCGLTEVSTWNLPDLAQFDAEMGQMQKNAFVFAVEPAVLALAIRLGLRTGLEQGLVPPYALLRLAEALGNMGWSAESRNAAEILESSYADLESRYRNAGNWRRILAAGAARPFQRLTESWQLCQTHKDHTICRQSSALGQWSEQLAVDSLCDTLLEARRHHWLDQLLWTLQWLRFAPHCTAQLWQYLWVTAREIHHQRPMREIPFCRMLARQALSRRCHGQAQPETRPKRDRILMRRIK